MTNNYMTIVPNNELKEIKEVLKTLASKLDSNGAYNNSNIPEYLTAVEFMERLSISRSKFDMLVLKGKIRTIKKGRKIYVPATEVERYFTDSSIK